MENRKKKTMETDHYLRTIKQNYKDNVVDCYRFFHRWSQTVSYQVKIKQIKKRTILKNCPPTPPLTQ